MRLGQRRLAVEQVWQAQIAAIGDVVAHRLSDAAKNRRVDLILAARAATIVRLLARLKAVC
jgi:hypothetical protein